MELSGQLFTRRQHERSADSEGQSKAFITALRQNPDLLSLSTSNTVPGQGFNGYGIIPEGHTLNEHLLASVIETDADFASSSH